ncbi:FAD-dependent monooxygenase [Labedaea rhizosphaerae]|uniref:2-polyprenyl-6-methoxyphenol hydroxylase-like FAD-dependent oxidoreductase n=1 Tax=Labedaea rhizosphaerae TaxID=598644 RepID=A0A4R6SJ30_LABRH|nr:FAD-dependent monooxygenase [Labedaea rhizosphaerae]TDQ01396.1 2-polyprenyl-6-methoxyphenol hydroxylase-like FAD-dependent oxidoreductase [Labedaea rhizosphaerae]
MTKTGVLIVGGGVTGLTTALLLQQYGTPFLLVERHAGTSPQPKARRFNQRSMEVFRRLGVTDAIGAASKALANFQGMLTGATLAMATWPELTPNLTERIAQHAAFAELSPEPSVLCPQDVLEPVLRDAIDPAFLRFGTEVVDLHDQTAVLADGSTVEFEYVVAADGARSPIRERLGVARSGIGHLAANLDIYFRADLAELVRGREFNLCSIENPAASGAFVSINGTDRWLFSTTDGERDLDHWVSTLRTVIGIDVPVEIISILPWESGMYVADTYRGGRVFLAGDSAHVMPPMAAAGANTGIADADNLAWKLAFVLSGVAGEGLLDTYHAERYPVGYATAEFSSGSAGHLGDMIKSITSEKVAFDMGAAVFGAQYGEGGAFVPDGRSESPVDQYAPGGRPGTRIPHVWVKPGMSSLDLVSGLTLLATAEAWEMAASAAGVRCVAVDPEFAKLAGLLSGGAVLVRPDGIVGWHCAEMPPEPSALLADAVRRVTFAQPRA